MSNQLLQARRNSQRLRLSSYVLILTSSAIYGFDSALHYCGYALLSLFCIATQFWVVYSSNGVIASINARLERLGEEG